MSQKEDPGSLQEEQEAYLRDVTENLKRVRSLDGSPVDGWNESEVQLIKKFFRKFNLHRTRSKGPFHHYLEMDESVRKELVIFAGLLPLILHDAQARGLPLYYVSANAEGEARLKREIIEKGLPMGPALIRWGDAYTEFKSGQRKFWAIGDLDLPPGTTVSRPQDFRYMNENEPALTAGKALVEVAFNHFPSILIHQLGAESFIRPDIARDQVANAIRVQKEGVESSSGCLGLLSFLLLLILLGCAALAA